MTATRSRREQAVIQSSSRPQTTSTSVRLSPCSQMGTSTLSLLTATITIASSTTGGRWQQVFCLTEICRIHHIRHKTPPTIAFLDIKSAYDTVDRNIIWAALQRTVSPPFLRFIQHLFDHVTFKLSSTIADLANSTLTPEYYSAPFSHHFFYSIYFNCLLPFLRSSPLDLQQPSATINCLLYADDVVLIGTASQIRSAFHQCPTHSHQLGYRWNPAKRITLPSPPLDRIFDYISPGPTAAFSFRTHIPQPSRMLTRSTTAATKTGATK